MYNRIGKKNRMLVASARVATWVSVAKVVLGFSVHLPPLERGHPDRTQNIFGVNCWQLLLLARHSDLLPLHYHFIIITLSLHHSLHYYGVLFHFECLFHCFMSAVGCSPAAGVYRRKPFRRATTLSGTARQLSSSFQSSMGASGMDPSERSSRERRTGWCDGRRPSRDCELLLSGIHGIG